MGFGTFEDGQGKMDHVDVLILHLGGFVACTALTWAQVIG